MLLMLDWCFIHPMFSPELFLWNHLKPQTQTKQVKWFYSVFRCLTLIPWFHLTYLRHAELLGAFYTQCNT